MATQLLRRVLGSRSIQILSLTHPNSARAFSVDTTPITATLFPGDGIGPEIADSIKQVFRAADVPIEWEEHYVGTEVDPRTQSFLTWESLESVRRNRVGLKGPMATPIGKGHRSLNLTLRKELRWCLVKWWNGNQNGNRNENGNGIEWKADFFVWLGL